MDERTDAQIAADKLLDEAMEAQAAAYAEEGQPVGVVTASIGVYARTFYDDDGDSMTSIGICTPDDNTMPYHVAIGLLEVALTMYKDRVLGPDEGNF